jgi:hypothetical protein
VFWPLVLCFAVLRSTTSLVRSRRKFVCITAVRQSVSSVQIFVPHEVRACAYLRSFGSMQPKTDSACYRMQLAASMAFNPRPIKRCAQQRRLLLACDGSTLSQLCRNKGFVCSNGTTCSSMTKMRDTFDFIVVGGKSYIQTMLNLCECF